MRALNVVRCLMLMLACLQVSQAKVNYAYVANNASNTVSVINTTTHALVATIPVGTSPFAVAVNQAGTFAYVANYGSANISVITTSTNTVTATIPVGSAPDGIVFAPSGKVAYVANQGSNSVSVINTGTHVVTATIPVQNLPEGIAITPDGAYVWVANYGSNSVSVIATLTNKVVKTVTVGTGPVWVAVSPDRSTAYVTNYGPPSTVSVINIASGSVSTTISVPAGAYGDAVSPDGHWLYAASAGVVSVIDTSAQTVVQSVATGGGEYTLVSFTQDSAFAYVTAPTANAVDVIKTATMTVQGSINVGTTPIGVAITGTMKVSTVAGGYVGDGGTPLNAALGTPNSVVYDAAGNLYIADYFMNRIRKVTAATGIISTYAGTGICGYNGENVTAKTAMLCGPNALLIDASGNLIVSEAGNNRIRKISTTGKITTLAGNGISGYSGDSGPAVNAETGQPFKMAYDSAGNLYFAQAAHCVVRKVATSGTISTVAGNGTCGFSGDTGAATAAELNVPRGVAFDTAGDLYISDTLNHRIRKVTPGGIITTFAGTGVAGCSGDAGAAQSAKIGNPQGLKVRNNVLYIANGGCARIRAIDLSTNIISTYAGSTLGYDGDGHAATASEFAGITDILFDSSGNLLISDSFNSRVRKIAAGVVTTIVGGYLGDGSKATSAAFALAEAVAVDKSGNIFIADQTGNRIRKVSAGIMSTLAGNGVSGYAGDNGPAAGAMINEPSGVAVDSLGNVFIADTYNGVIRKVDTTGKITTFASNGNFSDLLQMAVDSSNNLYVADAGSCVVWKITPAAVVTAAAGILFSCGYNGDNISATAAKLNAPYGVAVDSHGNLLIADYGNSRVREVTSGVIVTIAGNGTCAYTGDWGSPTSAEVCPNSVAVSSTGIVYIADFTFGRIREINSSGFMITFAGAGFGFDGDGLWPLYTTFDDPVAIAVDYKGAVYEVDDWDHRVRKIQ